MQSDHSNNADVLVTLATAASTLGGLMAHIQLQEELPGIRALLAFRPETAKPLGELADALLHAPGTLSPGEREMIAAYVSRLNDCTFCHNSHAAIAACHLENEDLVQSVMLSPNDADISEKLKALLAVAAKVQAGGSHRHGDSRRRAHRRRILHVQPLCRRSGDLGAKRSGRLSAASRLCGQT